MALEGLGDLCYFAKNHRPNIGTVGYIKVVEIAPLALPIRKESRFL